VVALHLITGPDRHVWLERESYPVADKSLPEMLGAMLIRSDALFNAALVSFGSFGIIHGVILETVPVFFLQVYRSQFALSDGLWSLLDTLNWEAAHLPRGAEVRPFHVQVVFNPHDVRGGPFVTIMYSDSVRPAGAPLLPPPGRFAPGDDAGALVGHFLDASPNLTSFAAGALLKQLFPEAKGECGTIGEVFRKTTTRGTLASSAIGIPLGRVREALELLLAVNHDIKFPGLFALRYVRSSRATLAFTRHESQTCVLELDAPVSKMSRRFLTAAWGALKERGIPMTFHWGKLQPLDPTLLRQMYGDAAIQGWLEARCRILGGGELRHVFNNRMLATLELDRSVPIAPGDV
jgi:hypothetical protein